MRKKVTQFLGALYFYVSRTPSYTAVGYWARRLFRGQQPFDFGGQTWLITGASGGLGRAAALGALRAGARVMAVARDPVKLTALVDSLSAGYADRIQTVVADMSLQSATEKLLTELPTAAPTVDVLLNNVGVLLNDLTITQEGREASFVTNLLSHYQLTEGLIAGGTLRSGGVVVNISSGALYTVPLAARSLNIVDPKRYQGKAAYAFSKRGQVALTEHWNQEYGPQIRFYTMHPGWARTQGVRDALPLFWKIQNLILRTPAQGIDTALWLAATRPSVDREVVWFDRQPRSTHAFPISRNPLCTREEFIQCLREELARRPVQRSASAQRG